MGIEAAAAIGLIGVASSVMQRDAAVDQGRAQERGAMAQLDQQRQDRSLAMAAAEPSPDELIAIERNLRANERDIQRNERVLDAVDPALIEAGRQALQLMQGEEAKTIDPIRKARLRQRQELESQLRQRLGSGYADTTSGNRALAEFDYQTDTLMAQEQDRSLGTLLGSSQFSRQVADITPNINAGTSLASVLGNIGNRRVNAITGTPINEAGAPFVAEALGAQAQGQFWNNIMNSAMTAGSAYALGQGEGTKKAGTTK